jgi:hypothetical protein
MDLNGVFILALCLSVSYGTNVTIENLCKNCTSNGISTYFKTVMYAASDPRYYCFRVPPTSNLSFFVGRWCNPQECESIEGHKISKIYTHEELNCSISLEYDTDNFTSMNIRNNSINYFNTCYNNTTLFAAWSVFVLLQILLLILFQIKNIKRLFEKVVVSLKLLLTRLNITQ